MNQPEPELDDDQPLEPAMERVRGKLVRFMAINLGLLFVALMAVVLAIVYRWTRTPEPDAAPAAETATIPQGDDRIQTVPLPEGARVTSQSLEGNRLALDTINTDGSRVLVIYDFAAGRVIARVALPAL
ncbi:fimbrial protein [Tianweitania sp. BSSL-BM11]|uniref:Fimbrial protein n=1 Tax=Tianweitania aestuarii TaxID=2814886 RepID=A0ABS5RZR8_9HYPH|nr:fimbrial protein [Tianweitania aestuarii]MBS9722550.1 fimbrial protein [Tianweitania aestuarii]